MYSNLATPQRHAHTVSVIKLDVDSFFLHLLHNSGIE